MPLTWKDINPNMTVDTSKLHDLEFDNLGFSKSACNCWLSAGAIEVPDGSFSTLLYATPLERNYRDLTDSELDYLNDVESEWVCERYLESLI